METRTGTCCKCKESDYIDFMAKIDGKRYCQSCYDDEMDEMENRCWQDKLAYQENNNGAF